MTNEECAKALENLRFGIRMLNLYIPEENKDTIDIEALDYAITTLKNLEEKTGYWIAENYVKEHIDGFNLSFVTHETHFKCSHCERYDEFDHKFCHCCGTKMLKTDWSNVYDGF